MVERMTLSTIHETAASIWQQCSTLRIWAFHAPMGSGKTTFIHALCEVLQVKDVVSSPTFAIINEYHSPIAGTIYHMDWYRLKDEEEAIQAGVEDALMSGHLCLIEWPENAEGLLPDHTLPLYITTTANPNERLLEVR
jgi:tRNA threonylcarbamoyladenosine biosynthesis protein TsaE